MTLGAKHFRWARTQTQTPNTSNVLGEAKELILDISFDTNDDVDSYA